MQLTLFECSATVAQFARERICWTRTSLICYILPEQKQRQNVAHVHGKLIAPGVSMYKDVQIYPCQSSFVPETPSLKVRRGMQRNESKLTVYRFGHLCVCVRYAMQSNILKIIGSTKPVVSLIISWRFIIRRRSSVPRIRDGCGMRATLLALVLIQRWVRRMKRIWKFAF